MCRIDEISNIHATYSYSFFKVQNWDSQQGQRQLLENIRRFVISIFDTFQIAFLWDTLNIRFLKWTQSKYFSRPFFLFRSKFTHRFLNWMHEPKFQYWRDSNTTSSSINYYTRAALENIYCITILDVYYVWWCCAWTYQRYQHQPSKLLSLDQTHHLVQAAFAAFADDRGRDVHTRPHQGVQLLDDVSQNQDGAVFTHLP